jgi:hypothetical protein
MLTASIQRRRTAHDGRHVSEYISHVKVMIIVESLLTSAVASTGSNCARGVRVRTIRSGPLPPVDESHTVTLSALRSTRTATGRPRTRTLARVGSQDGVSRRCGSGAWWLPRGRTRRRSEGGHTREMSPTGQGIAWISAVRINSANRMIDLPRPGKGKSLGRGVCYTDGCRRR